MKSPQELNQIIKELREELKEEKNSLKNFIEFNPYSIEIMDTEGHFVKANKAFYKLYKIAPPKQLSVFNSKYMQRLGVVRGLKEAKEGKVYKSLHLWFDVHEELPIFPSRPMCLTVTAFPIYNTQKKVKYLVFMHENVTEEEKAKEELKRKERELNSIINSTRDAIISFDNKFKIIFWNNGAENIFGFTKEEIINQPFEKIIAKEDKEKIYEQTKSYFDIEQKDIKKNISEMIGLSKNNEKINLELTFSFRNVTKDNFIVGRIVTVFIRDVAKTKRFLELQKKNDELARFNELMVDRELKMTELKAELDALKNKQQQQIN